MLFYLVSALPYILQLLLIIHIIRNGKPFLWLWLIVFLPYIGGIVYLVMEVLPDLRSGGSVSRMGAAVANAVNPGRA
ncbi:MAG: PLDc N-terminal domain-containing protein, partial [Treponema sp.]|nr:PLDc N-terminal domain-containing protein [Treponema sp.]